jgi:hypothetical protein
VIRGPRGVEKHIHEAIAATGQWAADGPRQPVSAAFVAWLLCTTPEQLPEGPSQLKLHGLALDGELDLTARELAVPVTLVDCLVPTLKLEDARTRSLKLEQCDLEDVDLTGAKVEGTLSITGSKVSGACVLRQAMVSRTVNFSGTCIVGRRAGAIDGDRLTVEGGMFLRDGFETRRGGVRLRGATIKGQLGCEAATLRGGDRALDLDGARIGGGVLLTGRPATSASEPGRPFSATGEVRLTGARVDGVIECDGTFRAPPARPPKTPVAFRANGLVAAVNLYFGKGFVAHGEVRVVGARVERDLSCLAGRLLHQGGVTLDLSRTTVAGRLEYTPGEVLGTVRLCNTTVGRLEDDIDAWPRAAEDLDLDGLTYDSLGSISGTREATLRERLGWLDGTYRPQPYEQLVAFYRRDGQEQSARAVGLRKQRRRRASLPWWQRPWGYLLDGLLGYGYYPAIALAWLATLLIAGSVWFANLQASGALQPRGGSTPQPSFSAPLYTLDLLLPVVSLKQRDAWIAVSHEAQAVIAVYIALGWVIGTAVVAALAGLIRRD